MRKGFSLVEIIVAVALIVTFISSILAASNIELKAVDASNRKTKAAFLLTEGIEAIRSIRDRGWSTEIEPLLLGTTYYLTFSVNWKLVAIDPGLIDNRYTRSVEFSNVYRKTLDDDIVDSESPFPKTLDPNIKRVTVHVAWPENGTTTEQRFSTYITNLFAN